MNRRNFIKVISSYLLLTSGPMRANHLSQRLDRHDNARPNILWIVADDLGTDLACYGNPVVKTPYLDQLAKEGILYTNCYTVAAVCSPSRSGLITGMYPSSINCHHHRTHFKNKLPNDVNVIPKYFKQAGYFTCNGDSEDRQKPGKQDYNFIADNIYDGTDWSQRKSGQPFFAQIQIFDPHRPFHRDYENPINPERIQLPPYYPDHIVARCDWAHYLENIQIVDKKVGKILERLVNEGLADNTVVFFFGDQGQPHVRAKQFLYDAGIHTPLIIRWPNNIEPGIVVEDLVSNIDIAPTSLNMAEIDIPTHIQGHNFWNSTHKREFIFVGRDRCDETVDRIHCIRNQRYKYIRNYYPERPYTQYNAYKKYRYPMLTLMRVLKKQDKLNRVQSIHMAEIRPNEELYDLKNDPYEINNLIESYQHRKILASLRSNLADWLEKFDKGDYPEDPREQVYWSKIMAEIYEKEMIKKGLSPEISDVDYLNYWENYLKSK